MSKPTAVIIGAGFGGLATACILGKAGWKVTVLEKNEQIGGRAGVLKAKGFTFDMGPSWYLMPDVFEHFFALVGENINDHLNLKRLSPSYRVFFKDVHDRPYDIYGDLKKDQDTFEALEPGSSQKLADYLKRSEYIYKTSMDKFLYQNYDGLRDIMKPSLIGEAHKLSLFSNMDRYVRSYFSSPETQKIMEYPLVFLGASPYNAPALYSLMSHVDFNQGVFYPDGGFGSVVRAIKTIGNKYGVTYKTNATVKKIIVEGGRATGVVTDQELFKADVVISNADIHHTETKLLDSTQRDHSDHYWQRRTLAPSALLMYLGVKGSLPQLLHHNLIFSKDWQTNFNQIFKTKQWPSDPSLYICNPSKTDSSVAPKDHENVFILVPLPAQLSYTDQELERYANKILDTIETEIKVPDLRQRIVYQKLFAAKDFATRYNSLEGTGLGLAHTLKQTALFRPKNTSRKVAGLYYVGANTHPGIGVPVTLISAELASQKILKTKK